MQFIPSNRDDIIRYYKNTFVKFKEYGEQLFYIEHVESNRISGKHESGENFTLWLDDDTPYEVDYILPHKSVFQFGSYATLLQRHPAKQYSRGLCSGNTQLSYLNNSGKVENLNLSFEVLKKFVEKQAFYNLRAAIGEMNNVTSALSSRMFYHRLSRQIYVDLCPIGRVQPSKLTIALNKPIFKDEVVAMLASHGEQDIFKVEKYVPPPPKQKMKPEDLVKAMEVEL